jgi:hypothetical protein
MGTERREERRDRRTVPRGGRRASDPQEDRREMERRFADLAREITPGNTDEIGVRDQDAAK